MSARAAVRCLVATLAAGALAAGCSRGEDASPDPSTAATATAAATTQAAPPPAPAPPSPPPPPPPPQYPHPTEKAPTVPELAWVGRYHTWAAPLLAAVRTGERIQADATLVRRAFRPGTQQGRTLRRALGRMRGCEGAMRRVERAPTPRLREVDRLIRRACRHLQEAARMAGRALAARDEPAVGAAAEEWRSGSNLLEEATLELRDYRPSDGRELPTIAKASSRSRIQPVYGRVAGRLVGLTIEVRCWSKRHWRRIERESAAWADEDSRDDILGFVLGRASRVNLHPDTCRGLDDLRYRGLRPTAGEAARDVAAGVVILSHEAQHFAGVANEATAECYGLQHARRAARLLGASRAYADTLAALYVAEVYPYLLPEYRSSECRDGGRLDLRPRSSIWP